VIRGKGRPSEPEAADGQEGRLHAGEVETAFGGVEGGAAFVADVAAREGLLVNGDDGAEDGADAACGEDCVGAFEAEAVVVLED